MNKLHWILPISLAFVWLLGDQILKIWVKTSMVIGETIPLISDWGFLYFIENKGMAFGMEFGGDTGKLILTSIRIIAIIGIAIWFQRRYKEKAIFLELISIALIFAGALGNIIDSVFYAKFFEESVGTEPAKFLADGNGNGNYLFGKVVDMFYFPIIDTMWPEWFPFWGGERFTFFKPIFNVADVGISLGVGLLFLCYIFFKQEKEIKPAADNTISKSKQVEALLPKSHKNPVDALPDIDDDFID